LSDDPTLVDMRDSPEFGQNYVPRGIENAPYVPTAGMRGQPERIHPLVHAWRESANQWRDRFHREEQRTAFWRSIAVGQAIGVVLGLLAWRVL
jgi:hypothetical protein